MADLRFSISKLNNVNYEIWKSKVELLLIKEDLWDTVNKDKPAVANEKWTKDDSQARATIGLLLEDDQFIHFKGTKTAKEAWEALRKYHQKASLSNQVHLLKRIINLKLTEDGDMEKYIHEMLSLVDRLAAIEEVLKEKLIISIMLSNLPDSFGTLITALETRNEDVLTLELIKGKLVDKATRR
ncbi:Copia protein [Anthophora retusa]